MSECNGYRGEFGSDDTVSEARLPLQLTTAVLSVVELAKHFLQLHHLQTTTQRRLNHSSPDSVCLLTLRALQMFVLSAPALPSPPPPLSVSV